MSDQTQIGDHVPIPQSESAGGRIGPFKILQLLGEGGFGSVFEAEQDQPVKRRVALKVIKLGMDTREVITRFEAERQALALMDHPHIARVLDAGATDSGRPYFVMELVRGEPISSYCRKHALSIVQRLQLFEQVCTAVQHAHGKGIIHRDLKPNNVLVSTQDDAPFAKVIDFGIAKATSGRLTDKTMFTEMNLMMGTPLYMSPEQAEGSADIDTRADIYSLGVILYELLTDTTPIDAQSLRSAGYAEVQRIIREVEPPRPSARMSGSASSESRRLARMLRGELDWIVMKAIEKDRKRRYETANALALDVRRYLAGEAVLAAPPSASYRLRKFVARNKGPVATGSLIAISLLVGIAAFAWQARVAQARADELQKVSNFQAAMLGQVDPTRAGRLLSDDVQNKFAAALVKAGVPEAERTAQVAAFGARWQRINATDTATDLIDRTILKPAVAAIDRQFRQQPAVDATLRQALADRYVGMGLYDAALPLQQRALAIRRRELGDQHPDTLTSITETGELLQFAGKLDQAEPYYREALRNSPRVLGAEHPETIAAISDMGKLLLGRGKPDQAEPYLRRALRLSRHALGDDHPSTLDAIVNLADLLDDQGKLTEAEAYYRESLDRSRRVLGEEDPHTLVSISNIGRILREQGKLVEAEPYLRDVLEKRRRVLGEEHPDTLESINTLGVLLLSEGKLSEAERYLREALEKSRRIQGDNNPSTLVVIGNLGNLLADEGKLGEAESYLREVVEKKRRLLGEEHPGTLVSMFNLGELLKEDGKLKEAEPFLLEALQTSRRSLGNAHPDTLIFINSLGSLRVDQGKFGEAVDLLTPAEAETRKQFAGESSRRLAAFLENLGKARTGLRQYAAAESNLLEARGIFDRIPSPKRAKDLRECTRALIGLYIAWNIAERGNGYDEKAADWKRKLDALGDPDAGAGH